MRRLGGLFLLVLGLVGLLAGAAVMAVFGTDDRWSTGPHELASDGAAITTAPSAIVYAGPRVELTVVCRDEARDLFVGVGHHVDVQDLLGQTPRTRVDRIDLPWEVSTTEVGAGAHDAGAGGGGTPRSAAGSSPTELDWWYAQASGRGRVVLTWTLPEIGGDVVILDQNGENGLAVEVTAAWVVDGSFVTGAAAVVIGAGVVVFGWAVLSAPRARPRGLHAERDHEAGRP